MGSKKKEKEGVADFMKAALGASEKEFGKKGTYVAAEHEKRHCGLELPALSLRWLIHSNVWPIQKLTLSGGAPGSCKSAFNFQLAKWWLEAGGFVTFIDTENKLSANLMNSIIPTELMGNMIIENATTIEKWQAGVTLKIKAMYEYVLKNKAKPSFMVLAIVDSMTGADSKESVDFIHKNLAAKGRQFSTAPLVINQFLKPLATDILGLPLAVHISNHEKPGMSEGRGSPAPRRPGGQAPDFHNSLDVRFRKFTGKSGLGSYAAGSSKIDLLASTGVQGWKISMSVRKNSFGPTIGKEILVPFLWTFVQDEDGGPDKQVSWWDWDTATTHLLLLRTKTIKEIMDIGYKNVDQRRHFFSKALGVSEDEPLSSTDFGKAVHSNQDLMQALQDVFHIPRFQLYTPGMLEYADDQATAKAYLSRGDGDGDDND